MLRVIHIINGLHTGGAELTLFRLVSHADRSAFDMRVVSLERDGPVGAKIRAEGIPVYCLNMSVSRPNPFALLQLIGLLRRERPHIVQTWIQHSDLLGGLASKFAGVGPVLWNVRHSTMHPAYTKKRTRAVTRVCAWLSPYLPTKIVCCSEASRREQSRIGYAGEKMVVIPNGVNTITFKVDERARQSMRRELKIAPNTLLFGASGRLHPQKGYRTLMLAAEKLFLACPNSELAICGDNVTSQNSEIRQWMSAAGFADRVHLLGRRDDMPRFMAGLDIFVSASSEEGFPNVVGEAMACGVPCVVTDVGDSARIVASTGRVVPPEDPCALANACIDIVSIGAEALRKLGQEASARIASQFSMPKMVTQYQRLYTETATPQ